MATINFKHLRYFWTVAKSGSIARASSQLHVTPQSISSQLAELEMALGTGLFRRVGRGLEITDIGRRIVSYAEEIFGLEDELLAVVRDQGSRTALPFRIGIADAVPKSLTYRVAEPALHLDETVRLFCKEGRLVSLLADLSVHRLDMVIADRAMPTDLKVRAYNHLLGSSDVTVFGAEALLQTLKGTFPGLVDNAPFLLPGEEVAIRPLLEQWFEAQRVRPRVIGEFDDSALLKAFGQGGS
jgi:LysR family transcriptional regulator, transcriptional activator of nhaA